MSKYPDSRENTVGDGDHICKGAGKKRTREMRERSNQKEKKKGINAHVHLEAKLGLLYFTSQANIILLYSQPLKGKPS